MDREDIGRMEKCTAAYQCPSHPGALGIHPPTLHVDVEAELSEWADAAALIKTLYVASGEARTSYQAGYVKALVDLADELGIELP